MKLSRKYVNYNRGIGTDGEGILTVSDCTYQKEDFIRNPESVTFVLDQGVTDVEKGFFDVFLTLDEIIIADSVKHIGVTDETLALFQKNDVMIRGSFDSYAEAFARTHHLQFMHPDIFLAEDGNYFDRGVDAITLLFYPTGKPTILQDCRCQGISAGNTGGGELRLSLPEDFYRYMSAKDIAGMCWGSCYDKICQNTRLKAFLNKAKKKNGYRFRF